MKLSDEKLQEMQTRRDELLQYLKLKDEEIAEMQNQREILM
jgi:ribosomal protein S15P/S13E